MAQIPYVLPQLCTFIDRDFFEMLVKRYHANAYVKSFSCWNQLVTMTWAHPAESACVTLNVHFVGIGPNFIVWASARTSPATP